MVIQDELLGQAACGMARSGRSSLAGGLVDVISGETFNLGAQADGRFFLFLVRLALMAPQHAQTLSVDLPIASVFFPASSGLASDTVIESLYHFICIILLLLLLFYYYLSTAPTSQKMWRLLLRVRRCVGMCVCFVCVPACVLCVLVSGLAKNDNRVQE